MSKSEPQDNILQRVVVGEPGFSMVFFFLCPLTIGVVLTEDEQLLVAVLGGLPETFDARPVRPSAALTARRCRPVLLHLLLRVGRENPV